MYGYNIGLATLVYSYISGPYGRISERPAINQPEQRSAPDLRIRDDIPFSPGLSCSFSPYFHFPFANIHNPYRHQREMEPKENLESVVGGECTVGLVPSHGSEINKFRSAAPPPSPHCCERRSLIVTLVIACAINTLVALFALALVLNARAEIGRLQFVQTKFQEQKVRDSAEIGQLQTKLQQQKVQACLSSNTEYRLYSAIF